MDSRDKTAALIAQEIYEWSRQCIETPSDAHGGLPACPFAKQEWESEQVLIHVTSDLDAVVDVKAHYPPTAGHTHIFAWMAWDEMTAEEFNNWLDEQNKDHFGVWMMGFHPEAPEDETIPELKLPEDWPETDDYALILMQSLSRVVAASEKLLGTSYYESYDDEDIKLIYNRRESCNAWKEKVDEGLYRKEEERQIWRKQEEDPQ